VRKTGDHRRCGSVGRSRIAESGTVRVRETTAARGVFTDMAFDSSRELHHPRLEVRAAVDEEIDRRLR
jgi:hypothetical protein